MADLRREMPCQGYTVGIFERAQLVSRVLRHFPGLLRKLPIPICLRQSI
jgi:hypothetical protein